MADCTDGSAFGESYTGSVGGWCSRAIDLLLSFGRVRRSSRSGRATGSGERVVHPAVSVSHLVEAIVEDLKLDVRVKEIGKRLGRLL